MPYTKKAIWPWFKQKDTVPKYFFITAQHGRTPNSIPPKRNPAPKEIWRRPTPKQKTAKKDTFAVKI